MNTLIRYYPDFDMRNGHDGLFNSVKKSGLDPRTLSDGQFLCFVNKKRNKLKLYNGNDMVAYLRLNGQKRIDPKIIQNIPRYFDGKKINYDAAVSDMMKKYFPDYFSKKP